MMLRQLVELVAVSSPRFGGTCVTFDHIFLPLLVLLIVRV